MRLFCFPYAGGGAHVYHPWLPLLPASIEFCAINLPGRGTRIGEAPHSDCESLAKAITTELRSYVDKPFVFFGHSMGAIVCYEVARHLRAAGSRLPDHLFVSGCHAAHIPDPHPIHHLPKDEFLVELAALGGLPQEVLNSKELMDLILPGILADFTLVESYPYSNQPPLDCPIYALGASEDHLVTNEQLEAWNLHTTAGFKWKVFPGNHFFIHDTRETLVNLILQEVELAPVSTSR